MLLHLRVVVDRTSWAFVLSRLLLMALTKTSGKRESFIIFEACRKKKKIDKRCSFKTRLSWFKHEILLKNKALPSGTWSHWKPLFSGKMRAVFPKQVAGLVFILGLPEAGWVGRRKEHVAGMVDRAAPSSSGGDGDVAGMALSQSSSASGCNYGIRNCPWSPEPRNSPRTMGRYRPLPRREAQVEGKKQPPWLLSLFLQLHS